MARGGKRPGAGRPKGSTNPVTEKRKEAAERALEDGVTPLEVMLDNMRWAHEKAAESDDSTEALKGYRAAACEWAKAAAPYVHPKLANIDHNHGGQGTAEILFKTVYETGPDGT
ncbi:MAG: hypothetical protein VX464_11735 [Pseudomonadota bacterium]|nr:hypothetical protein [Pseudomonadota bacterium]